ncbi:MAG: flavocytochrome c [Thermodesulfobacteriota bacterium]|nr:flavocytochrome c [Thermodesulfobacteriota bacterium]
MVKRIKDEREVLWDIETDIAVVGGGACGLIASLSAAEKGVEVLLLEKEKKLGGNTSLSQGMIPAAGTRFQKAAGIDDSAELMAEDIFKKNNYESDPEITLHLCRESKNLVEWLVDSVGIHLDIVTDFIYPGHSRHRIHAPSTRKGTQIVNELRTVISNRKDILLVQQSPVRDLIAKEDGSVIGLEVEIFGQGINRVRAQKVILACNGFGNNKEMLRKYIPEMADAFYFGHEGNTGEGILWGIELGTATQHMGAYQAHGSVAYPHAILLTWVVIVNGGFQVNKQGKRFSNEYTGYSEHAIEVLNQEDKIAIEIFDERIYQSVLGFEDFNQCIEIGAMKRGETIEELADLFQLPPKELRKTLESYNRATEGKGEDPMGRQNFQGPLKSPYYGVRVTGALFHTQGGLKVNKRTQVLKPDGSTIPNLYAGGGVAVGVSGSNVKGYSSANGLLAATVLGKIAGEEAAASIKG